MFNQYEFNNSTFNEIINESSTIAQDDIVYNWYWLQNANITVSFADYDNWPNIDSPTFSRPRNNGWWELSYFFRERIVTMRGTLKAASKEELNTAIDDFKRAMWENQKNLDIKVNWTIRRAVASVINFDTMFQRENYHITYVPFELQFRVLSPFFAEITRNIQSFTSLTANLTEEIYNSWSAKSNPVTILTFSAATSVTEISFAIWTKSITINETINVNDVVKIDTEEKTVTINDVVKDYTWVFPELEVWNNSYTITIDWTKTYDITTYFYNKYI